MFISFKNRWVKDGKSKFEGDYPDQCTALEDACKQGIRFENTCFQGADLRRGQFTPEKIGSVFWDCDFTDAILVEAGLTAAGFQDSCLHRTNFIAANLAMAQFQGASLRYTKFQAANLYRARLVDCDMTGATFQGANLHDAEFAPKQGTFEASQIFDVPRDETLLQQVCEVVVQRGALAEGYIFDRDSVPGQKLTLQGWIVHLSNGGRFLESVTSTSVAGAILLPEASHMFFRHHTSVLAWCHEQLGK